MQVRFAPREGRAGSADHSAVPAPPASPGRPGYSVFCTTHGPSLQTTLAPLPGPPAVGPYCLLYSPSRPTSAQGAGATEAAGEVASVGPTPFPGENAFGLREEGCGNSPEICNPREPHLRGRVGLVAGPLVGTEASHLGTGRFGSRLCS